MANATTDLLTEYEPAALNQPTVSAPLAANYVAYGGTMQNRDANGRAKNPGAVGEVVAGVVTERKDATGLANDKLRAKLRRGPHWLDKHGVHPPTAADIGKMGYASDNHTISNDAADGSPAGEITEVESTKVRVDIGKAPLA